MGMIYPVHPDDVEQLLRIRRYLIGYRYTEGMTRQELSVKVNGTNGVVHDLEVNTTWQWRLRRLQDWCAAFGLRLDATIRMGTTIDKRIHDDPVVNQLYALSRSGGDVWKMSQSAYLTAGLRRAREIKRIRTIDVGKAMGTTASAVRNWERDADSIMIAKALHYARVLGGYIELGLAEKNGQA